jgi:hypothetical protein
MDLSSSLGAASMVNQSYAAQGAIAALAGANPTPGAVSALSQTATQATFAVGVLKASLAFQATTGEQLTQMISQGSGINISA